MLVCNNCWFGHRTVEELRACNAKEEAMTQPEKCPRCGSNKRNVRGRLPGDPLDFSHHDYWCEHPWHTDPAISPGGEPEQERELRKSLKDANESVSTRNREIVKLCKENADLRRQLQALNDDFYNKCVALGTAERQLQEAHERIQELEKK